MGNLRLPKAVFAAALVWAASFPAASVSKAAHRAAGTRPAPTKSARSSAVKAGASRQHTAANSGSRSRKRVPTAAYYRQSTPSPERYIQIQQALADRGYYSGPIDGNWSAEGVEALRRFQAEQNLEPDGKLGALSLIALGLGPKREPIQWPPQVLGKSDAATSSYR